MSGAHKPRHAAAAIALLPYLTTRAHDIRHWDIGGRSTAPVVFRTCKGTAATGVAVVRGSATREWPLRRISNSGATCGPGRTSCGARPTRSTRRAMRCVVARRIVLAWPRASAMPRSHSMCSVASSDPRPPPAAHFYAHTHTHTHTRAGAHTHVHIGTRTLRVGSGCVLLVHRSGRSARRVGHIGLRSARGRHGYARDAVRTTCL
jgi:hypothetical protein